MKKLFEDYIDLDIVCHMVYTVFVVIMLILGKYEIGIFDEDISTGVTFACFAYLVAYMPKFMRW